MEQAEAKQWWEERYGQSERIWSGRPNARLVEIASDLPAGRALDLGCGEGGDAVWLAERGWRVVAVDIADAALARAAEFAASRNVADRIEFQQHDLSATFPDGEFDLVSAHFLHSPWEWERSALLRRAAALVAPGGTLLVVDHGEAPPWAEIGHEHVFPSATEVLDGLALPEAEWERVRVGQATREGQGPDGQTGTLVDNLIVLRRR